MSVAVAAGAGCVLTAGGGSGADGSPPDGPADRPDGAPAGGDASVALDVCGAGVPDRSRLLTHFTLEGDPSEGATNEIPAGPVLACRDGFACPTVVPGRVGNGYRFAATDMGALSASAQLDLAGGFTVAAFVRVDDLTLFANGVGGIVHKRLGDLEANSVALSLRNNGDVIFDTDLDDLTRHHVEVPVGFTEGTWHHLAVTHDPGTLTKVVWLDGAPVASDIGMGAVFDDRPLTIGADEDTTQFDSFFDGTIDDIRIYAGVVAATEMAVLASCQN